MLPAIKQAREKEEKGEEGGEGGVWGILEQCWNDARIMEGGKEVEGGGEGGEGEGGGGRGGRGGGGGDGGGEEACIFPLAVPIASEGKYELYSFYEDVSHCRECVCWLLVLLRRTALKEAGVLGGEKERGGEGEGRDRRAEVAAQGACVYLLRMKYYCHDSSR